MTIESSAADASAMAAYDRTFYGYVDDTAAASADIVAPLVEQIVPIESVVDVGCGTGAWLASFKRLGADPVLGLDASTVPADLLQIEQDEFRVVDLVNPPEVERRFSLAISLEVAEHLPPSSADAFVDFLCSLAPVVLFSAAIPGQGGASHVNEQWPDYWASRFEAAGLQSFDVIRPMIWSDGRVSDFYRQNLVLYATDEASARMSLPADATRLPSPPMPLVHPESFATYQERMERIQATPLSLSAHLRALPGATRRAVSRRIGRG